MFNILFFVWLIIVRSLDFKLLDCRGEELFCCFLLLMLRLLSFIFFSGFFDLIVNIGEEIMNWYVGERYFRFKVLRLIFVLCKFELVGWMFCLSCEIIFVVLVGSRFLNLKFLVIVVVFNRWLCVMRLSKGRDL